MSYSMIAIALAASLSTSVAHAAPAGYFRIGPGAVLETGDTLLMGGKRIRIYGLQSCLRGTSYTDLSDEKRDCGEASIAVLAAFIKDTAPVCAPVAQQHEQTFVICFATVGNHGLDLAMMLIAEGYGFASLRPDGFPVHPPYAVAEQGARDGRKGLWQFKDVQHPAILLSKVAKNSRSLP
jgi:endonuclease YncB( thermonuclease family)